MGLDIKKCVAIQTARAGSVGVPNKNTMEFGGMPLFTHPLTAAIDAKGVDDIWVSTDDEIIKEWCNFDFMPVNLIERPDYLSTSDASHHDVIIHALENIGEKYEYVLLLLGNSIFTTPQEIDEAISILDNTPDATSI